jgi:hypothetical protein
VRISPRMGKKPSAEFWIKLTLGGAQEIGPDG